MDHTMIEAVIGIDMAKGDHFAQAITVGGEELFARPLTNDRTPSKQQSTKPARTAPWRW